MRGNPAVQQIEEIMQFRRRHALPLALALVSRAEAAGGVGWKELNLEQGRVYAVQGPKRSAAPRPVVLFHHGAGGTAKSVKDEPVQSALIEHLALAGYLVMSRTLVDRCGVITLTCATWTT